MKFILATCVRNEGPYLLEWAAHYKLLGFDRIVIYSNDNTDGSDELLAEMQNQGLIEWRPRTLDQNQSPQMSAFKGLSQELFSNKKEHGNYLAWFDCDEFLVLKSHDSVQELISHYQFPDGLYINWKHFGSSNLLKYEHELTISRFLGSDSASHHNKLGKCISRVDPKLFAFIINHRPVPLKQDDWGRIIYASDQIFDVPVARDIIYGANPKSNATAPIFHDVCQLNHYAVRSQEEYSWKSTRGNGWKPIDNSKIQFLKSYFRDHDLNNEQDSLAEKKYLVAIKNYLAELPVCLTDIEIRVIENAIKQSRCMAINDEPSIVEKRLSWLQLEQLHGYSVDEAIKRLAYGSFVGDSFNYVFMETPKAACSTLKWILADLEKREVNLKHSGQESLAAMIIHGRSSHGIKNLTQIPDNQRMRLLTDNNIVRFCVVRNPYARIVSAWADKVRQKEPGYEKVWQQVAQHHGSNPQVCPTFPEFIRWVVETQEPNRCNPHWRAMVYLLLPELLNYTHILHTENLVCELQEVLDRIAPDENAGALLKKHRTNETLPVDWQSFYDEKTAAQVALFYQDDFHQYGYSLDSWRTDTKAISLIDEIDLLKKKFQVYEGMALDAIRGRNDTIFELVKKKQVASKKITNK